MKKNRWLALVCFASVAAACGGTSTDLFGTGSDGGAGSGGDGGTASDGSGGRGDGSASSDSGTASDAAPINDSGICPDVRGRYSISHTGLGCGDLVNDSPQCIDENASCDIDIQSKRADAGLALGVNGTTNLQTDGTFSGASLTLGTIDRTGCTGAWDESGKTMTIDCGGTGVSQSCVVTLTRTSGGGCN